MVVKDWASKNKFFYWRLSFVWCHKLYINNIETHSALYLAEMYVARNTQGNTRTFLVPLCSSKNNSIDDVECWLYCWPAIKNYSKWEYKWNEINVRSVINTLCLLLFQDTHTNLCICVTYVPVVESFGILLRKMSFNCICITMNSAADSIR